MKSTSSGQNVTRQSPSVFGIKKDDAETHYEKRFPEVLKALSKVIENTPRLKTFEVGNSTSHQIAASTVN